MRKRSRDLAASTFAAALTGRPPSFTHVRALCDRYGIIQFAKGAKKDLDSGYCLDDNARALLAAVAALRLDPGHQDARYVGDLTLGFVQKCQRSDGLFHNLMNEEGRFVDDTGSQEAIGRAIWACGFTLRWAPDASWRDTARATFLRALPQLSTLTALRPRAYAILGLSAALAPSAAFVAGLVDSAPARRSMGDLDARPVSAAHVEARAALMELCNRLAAEFVQNADSGWQWWEPILTWGNGRLPEALLRGSIITQQARHREAGVAALEFLASITQPGVLFVPIGNDGWYQRGNNRPLYDQQPIEACAMVDAWLAAAALSEDERYHGRALDAFMWFFGLNTERLPLARPDIGACHDGLQPGRVNANMGAESTLSYVHAHLAIASALALGDTAKA